MKIYPDKWWEPKMEKRYVVPDGMLKAALDRWPCSGDEDHRTLDRLEAAIRWLSENPIVPTEQQWRNMETEVGDEKGWGLTSLRDLPECAVVEWQRRMFIVPEPEVPEAIKDLLWTISGDKEDHEHNSAILEAYRRGLESNRQGVKDRYDK